jgi:hypothetical protein
MKRLMVLALALTALAGGFAAPAFGINNIYLVPQNVTQPVGQTFAMACSISRIGSEPVGIISWTVRLYWDGSILHLVSVPNGGFLTGFEINQGDTSTASAYWDRAVVTLGAPQHAAEGLLCTWNFQVKAVGSCSIRFDPHPGLSGIDSADITVRSGFFQTLSGVEEGQKQGVTGQGYKVFPNPFGSFAAVSGHEGERFILYDISGRVVGEWSGAQVAAQARMIVPILQHGLSRGAYFLCVHSAGTILTKRVVVW